MSHAGPKLSPDAMMLLEQSLLRVPVEVMRKGHRTTTRTTDKDLAGIESSLRKAAKTRKATRTDKLKAVNAALSKLRGLHAKLEEGYSQQKALSASCRSRIRHLQQLHNLQSFSSRAYTDWSKLRLERQIVDTLLRRGYTNTAVQLARASGLDGLVDVEIHLFGELHAIETAIAAGSASEALAWCKDNGSALKKAKSTLEFDLRFQDFIELARARQQKQAIQYCRKHLIPSTTSAHNGPQRIRQAMALLAFEPDTQCPPYKALYDPKRWLAIATAFRNTFLSMHQLPPLPILNLGIWAGMAALKLPTCLSKDLTEHSTNCPSCDTSTFGRLAMAPEVPSGHHANSVIVCRITGKVLAGEDTAYALPNGMVYSGEACDDLAKQGNGTVCCPRTGGVYDFKDLKKVYIT